jgi:hypothetical protein
MDTPKGSSKEQQPYSCSFSPSVGDTYFIDVHDDRLSNGFSSPLIPIVQNKLSSSNSPLSSFNKLKISNSPSTSLFNITPVKSSKNNKTNDSKQLLKRYQSVLHSLKLINERRNSVIKRNENNNNNNNSQKSVVNQVQSAKKRRRQSVEVSKLLQGLASTLSNSPVNIKNIGISLTPKKISTIKEILSPYQQSPELLNIKNNAKLFQSSPELKSRRSQNNTKSAIKRKSFINRRTSQDMFDLQFGSNSPESNRVAMLNSTPIKKRTGSTPAKTKSGRKSNISLVSASPSELQMLKSMTQEIKFNLSKLRNDTNKSLLQKSKSLSSQYSQIKSPKQTISPQQTKSLTKSPKYVKSSISTPTKTVTSSPRPITTSSKLLQSPRSIQKITNQVNKMSDNSKYTSRTPTKAPLDMGRPLSSSKNIESATNSPINISSPYLSRPTTPKLISSRTTPIPSPKRTDIKLKSNQNQIIKSKSLKKSTTTKILPSTPVVTGRQLISRVSVPPLPDSPIEKELLIMPDSPFTDEFNSVSTTCIDDNEDDISSPVSSAIKIMTEMDSIQYDSPQHEDYNDVINQLSSSLSSTKPYISKTETDFSTTPLNELKNADKSMSTRSTKKSLDNKDNNDENEINIISRKSAYVQSPNTTRTSMRKKSQKQNIVSEEDEYDYDKIMGSVSNILEEIETAMLTSRLSI